MFCDEVKISVKAGRGGDGAISFRKEKFVPFGGPDGGDGGKGGNIVIKVDNNLHTLSEFNAKKKFAAEEGQSGMKKKMHGKNGENLILNVPPGTLVYDESKNTILADLTEAGEEYIPCKGGRGGFGNAHFKGSVRKTPRFAETGEPGEERDIVLEIKMIAEVGVIGLPSVGKSTLISHVSGAKPKIADYPFTTLIPNLGVVYLTKFGGDEEESFIIADLPGLIEGAHAGKGLGHKFLKHVQRTKVILHMIDITAEDPIKSYKIINDEISKYDKSLGEKPQIVALNKIDALSDKEWREKAKKIQTQLKLKKIFTISAVSGEGLRELLFEIWEKLSKLRKLEKNEKKDDNKTKPQLIRDLIRTDDKYVSIKTMENRGEHRVFKLSGKRLEQIVIMSDLKNDQALQRIYDVLNKFGVIKKLLRKGAEDGDIIQIGKDEIVFLNLLK